MSKCTALCRLLTALILTVLAISVSIAAETPEAANACRRDLARRLKLDQSKIKIASCQANTFADASLALPRVGEAYPQRATPGFSIILEANSLSYLYTATTRFLRYGGPLDSWRYSALYFKPNKKDINFNSDLYQVSLAGTNPRLLLPSASAAWPQANTSILVTRRTSRSGFTLFHVAANGKTTKIGSALDYEYATLNQDGTQWAALLRSGLGSGWQISWGPLQGSAYKPKILDLPPATSPGRIYWGQERFIIEVNTADGKAKYQLDANASGWDKVDTYLPPENGETMLNKSESLVVRAEQIDDKPVTRVVRRWFTDDEHPVATIRDFTVTDFSISPEQRFVLISGHTQDEKSRAYTVDLATGEVLPTVGAMQGRALLYLVPPAAWLQFGPVSLQAGN